MTNLLGWFTAPDFERDPAMLHTIARTLPVAGNSAETIRLVKDPASLSHLCAELQIPHPDIRFDTPEHSKEWLTKLTGGAGGSHVKPANGDNCSGGRYFQRFVPGGTFPHSFSPTGSMPMSSASAANGLRLPEKHPSAMAALSGCSATTREIQPRIAEWLSGLTKHTGLCGLCSADFVDSGPDLHLIEINPRPGATLDIFDNETTPLIREHLRAIMGTRVSVPAYENAKASAIAYTAKAISAFPEVVWPAQTADHQMPGTALGAGDPVCTVFATANSAAAAMRAVKDRVKEVAVHWRGGFPMRDGHAYLNRSAQHIADAMIEDADRLGIGHSRGSLGEHLIDAGANHQGGIEAGMRIVEICMGGLGKVSAALGNRANGRIPSMYAHHSQCLPALAANMPGGTYLTKLFRHGVRSGTRSRARRTAVRGNPLSGDRGQFVGRRA